MAHKAAIRYTGKLDRAGRLLIPAELRSRLGMKAGGSVSIKPAPGGRIVLTPVSVLIEEAQAYFQRLAPATVHWSDELIAERRREAKREIEN